MVNGELHSLRVPGAGWFPFEERILGFRTLFEEFRWLSFKRFSDLNDCGELNIFLTALDYLPVLSILNRHVVSRKVIDTAFLTLAKFPHSITKRP